MPVGKPASQASTVKDVGAGRGKARQKDPKHSHKTPPKHHKEGRSSPKPPSRLTRAPKQWGGGQIKQPTHAATPAATNTGAPRPSARKLTTADTARPGQERTTQRSHEHGPTRSRTPEQPLTRPRRGPHNSQPRQAGAESTQWGTSNSSGSTEQRPKQAEKANRLNRQSRGKQTKQGKAASN